MFFCPEVSLVKQQYEKMKKLFEHQAFNIEYLIGSEVQDKPSIAEMIKTEQVGFLNVVKPISLCSQDRTCEMTRQD